MALPEQQQKAILSAARALIGRKYHELDCSHFVQESYRTAGLTYPYTNTASFGSLVPEFFAAVPKLDQGEFQPADILMFGGHMGLWDPEGCRELKQAGTPDAECESASSPMPFLSSRSGDDRGPDFGKVNWFGALQAVYRWNKPGQATVREKTVIVIGSPTPDQTFPLQFVWAAECQGFDDSTIWLVEYTGYVLYELFIVPTLGKHALHPAAYLRDNYAMNGDTKDRFGWITPRYDLVKWLNMLAVPDGAIGRLIIYSHGVPGLIALRYGWGGDDYGHAGDYGLSAKEVAGISRKKLSKDAEIVVNACNTGLSDRAHLPWNWQEPLAQTLANRLHRPVLAWTGRTSYSSINHARSCLVRPSQYTTAPSDSLKEFGRRIENDGNPAHGPEQKIFKPEN